MKMQSKSMDWFLYDIGLRRERVKACQIYSDNWNYKQREFGNFHIFINFRLTLFERGIFVTSIFFLDIEITVYWLAQVDAGTCGVLQKRCSYKFHKILRKTPVPEEVCNFITFMNFSCEFWEISRNTLLREYLRWLLVNKSFPIFTNSIRTSMIFYF